ncbi:unnamed protein product [Effrenium voratum]|nr:unnamed protein product [Effrenium voratum]
MPINLVPRKVGPVNALGVSERRQAQVRARSEASTEEDSEERIRKRPPPRREISHQPRRVSARGRLTRREQREREEPRSVPSRAKRQRCRSLRGSKRSRSNTTRSC